MTKGREKEKTKLDLSAVVVLGLGFMLYGWFCMGYEETHYLDALVSVLRNERQVIILVTIIHLRKFEQEKTMFSAHKEDIIGR